MLLDGGSGSNFYKSNDWWIYSGELRRPPTTSLRGACSRGWRGETSYPLSWEDVDRNAPHLYDTRQIQDDWARHIDDVEARAVPVPDVLVALLDQVEQELAGLASDAPLAALGAISRLEHVIAEAGDAAAYGAEADARSGTLIGPGLGLPENEGRRRLLSYSLRR
ncbi:hypothetical protein [Streptomyces sp. MNU77]|uniref:hypothetical protein n=1 Tax=Streptomyces sp. MNU77 TaxID=1573406 RepID=UPI0006986144|nr:hypothetical protein [Streptomyces sp. MNU77]